MIGGMHSAITFNLSNRWSGWRVCRRVRWGM